VDYVPTAQGGQVNVVMQESPQTSAGSSPDWVTYFVQDPQTRQFVHTTRFMVPENTRVNVTIYGYDGCTPLRNNYWSQVRGTIGGTVNVQQFGKGDRPLGPAKNESVINSWATCSVAHTFSIPSLHLFVPDASPGPSANLCGTSPCTPSSPHVVEKFSFRTPGHGGVWRWQCLVPCGGGFLDGNSGPMQTFGYMMGDMQVVS